MKTTQVVPAVRIRNSEKHKRRATAPAALAPGSKESNSQ